MMSHNSEQDREEIEKAAYMALDMHNNTGGDVSYVAKDGGSSSCRCLGTTLIGCKCNGRVTMISDGLAFVSLSDLNEGERAKKQKRDSADVRSTTEFMTRYDKVKSTYGWSDVDEENLKREMSYIKDYYVRYCDVLKVDLLGTLCCIMLGTAGYTDVGRHIKKELEKEIKLLELMGQIMSIEMCAEFCLNLLGKEGEFKEYDISEADLAKHPTVILIGGYETDMENLRGDRYPRLFMVTKGLNVEIETYYCTGQGKFLADKVMEHHFGEKTYDKIEKEEVVFGLREAMEAASLAQGSGGVVRTVTLDSNNYLNTAAVDYIFYES